MGPSNTLMLVQKRGSPALLLPDLMKVVYLGQRTGLLHVTRDEETRMSFRSVGGEIVSGASSEERGRLGESLVRRGLLKRADLERALVRVCEQGRRLAPVLCELGLLDAAELEQALAFHIREMLVTALSWEHAWLIFEDQERPVALPEAPAEDFSLRCSTGELLLELVRRIPSSETVRFALGNLDRRLAKVTEPLARLERAGLGAADRYVIASVDGSRTARALIERAKLPTELVERSLLGLLLTGALRQLPPLTQTVLALRPAPGRTRLSGD
jgi:uncharacterized protein DUF4388